MNFGMRSLLCITLTMIPSTLLSVIGVENSFFYRANHFFGEPRFERTKLTSIDIIANGGGSRTARDCNGDKTCLLNLCGPHNMHQLGVGVPNKDLSSPLDLTLNNLADIPARDSFGKLLFTGKFNYYEVVIDIAHNITSDFFVEMIMPFRSLSIEDISFCDLSPTDTQCPNKNTPEWQLFLTLFKDILNRYDLDWHDTSNTGIGDTTFYLGWTNNYQGNEILDYIDFTLRAGISVPSGACADENILFDLPLGHQNHIGFPITVHSALGAYDWMTLGGYFGVMLFLDKKRNLRLKTAPDQNGLITLAQGTAIVCRGTQWQTGGFIKADHFYRGFSCLLGYSYSHKNHDTLCACDTKLFPECIIQSDCRFQEWTMHVLHLLAEYEITSHKENVSVRISGFYNQVVGGKKIFNAHNGGAIFGMDVSWSFD